MEALIFPALLFVVMYVALILPQQRRAKEARQLLSSLHEGDEVITTSGIHGFINNLDEAVIWLEVADGVELKMSRSSVTGKINDIGDGDDEGDDDTVASGLGDTDEID